MGIGQSVSEDFLLWEFNNSVAHDTWLFGVAWSSLLLKYSMLLDGSEQQHIPYELVQALNTDNWLLFFLGKTGIQSVFVSRGLFEFSQDENSLHVNKTYWENYATCFHKRTRCWWHLDHGLGWDGEVVDSKALAVFSP